VDAPRWQRLSQLFDGLLELPPQQREQYIVENCASDAELEAAFRRMLEADAAAGDFLEAPLHALEAGHWRGDDTQEGGYAPGSRHFGPYRLLRLVGQGGMGEVHLAERADGAFEQRVALKLLPYPTPGLLQRFQQERQILAQLEHPNIARLLDGGIGEHNVPYFAMEFVDGVPIQRHVGARALDTWQTLGLFLQVCDAVQHAHRALIVHRDLKPSNILVGTDGTPKLLDFGIAKVLGPATGEATRTATRMLTPEYAAPEQLRGEAVTTATDVYALGVVLYELLTGRRPHARAAALEQADTAGEARAPSAVTGLAPRRRRELRGDLDRVVLNALAFDPQRRYPSVEAFAADIRACLERRPISVQRDRPLYVLRKFVARNRVVVAVGLLVATALAASAAISLLQWRKAQQQAARADAVNGFLETIFRSINPANARGREVGAIELIDAGAARIDRDLAGQDGAAAQLHATLGETYFALGDYAKAEAQLRAALPRFQPDQLALSIAALGKLAELRLRSGASAEAQRLLDEASARAERDLPHDTALADRLLGMRAAFAATRGENGLALQLGERRWQSVRARVGADAPESIDAEQAYAAYLNGASRHADAVAHQSEVVARQRRLAGADSPQLAEALDKLGNFQSYLGEPDAMLASLDEALAIRRRILPHNHPDIARSLNQIGEQLQEVGRAQQALPLEDEALAILRAQQQPDKLLLAEVLNNRGVACHYTGDDACAVARVREALALWQSVFAPEHTYVLTARSNLAALLTSNGDLKAAEQQLREVAAARTADIERNGDSEEKSNAVHHTRELLALNLHYQHREDEALALARDNFAAVEARFPAPKIDHMEALLMVARIELYNGDYSAAQTHAQAALEECDRLKLGQVENRGWMNFVLAHAALRTQHAQDALALAQRAMQVFEQTLGGEHPKTAEVRGLLGRVLGALHRGDEARRELDAAIAVLAARQPWQPALAELRAARAAL